MQIMIKIDFHANFQIQSLKFLTKNHENQYLTIKFKDQYKGQINIYIFTYINT